MFSLFKAKNKSQTEDDQPSDLMNVQAYIIGDVHGCFNQMIDLLKKIKLDIDSNPPQETVIVFLGDLIDRGPQSAQVLEFLQGYNPTYAKVIFLMGNHEEVFLSVLDGDVKALGSWFGFGGRDCLRSYGVTNLGMIHSFPERILEEIRKKVPTEHIDFIRGFGDYLVLGPYLCVHAGIRPNLPLEKQSSKDMRWIREAFLKHDKPHPKIVVHGHSIVDEPERMSNRIAIDTGAYSGGRLTALCISDDGERFLQSDVAD